MIYSNDLTNITSCISPFHAAVAPFRPEMLDATVDEVAGLVDAHFLQPGFGMVPLWPSKVFDQRMDDVVQWQRGHRDEPCL